MEIDECIEKIANYLCSASEKIIHIDERDDLIELGLLNSLKLINLIVFIENIRGQTIAIEDISIEKLRTISSIRENFFTNRE